MRLFVFFIFIFSAKILYGTDIEKVKAFTNALSSDQRTTLVRFLNTLIESFSGYVLHGDKPLCIEAYPLSYESGAVSGVNKESHTLINGVHLWQSLNLPLENKQYLFLIFDIEDYGYCHLICINRKAFLHAVNENLSLFRYVLGPTLTAEGLLNELIAKKEQFYKILKEDNVLLGILLGYGKQNALLVSREEYLADAFGGKERFPFLSKLSDHPVNNQEPSLGYLSTEDELKAIKNLLAVSRTLKPFEDLKIPYFGCEPYSQESKNLLSLYEKNRQEIIEALKRDDFIEETLAKLFTTTSNVLEIPSLPSFSLATLSESKDKIVFKLASAIIQEIEEEKFFQPSFLQAFLDGVNDKNEEKVEVETVQTTVKRRLDLYFIEKELESVQNLQKANDYFKQLPYRKKLLTLIPGKVYYKVLKKGKGTSCSSKLQKASFHYSFRILDSENGDFGTHKLENIEQFIPGVAYGLIGMKRGEMRKLYIHPEYGYGHQSFLPSNSAIIATIELIDFEEGEVKAKIVPALSNEEKGSHNVVEKHENLKKKDFYANGVNVWDFLKKNSTLDYQTFKDAFAFAKRANPFKNSKQRDQFLIDLYSSLINKTPLSNPRVTVSDPE